MSSETIIRFSRDRDSRPLVSETNYESLKNETGQSNRRKDDEFDSFLLNPQKYFEFR